MTPKQELAVYERALELSIKVIAKTTPHYSCPCNPRCEHWWLKNIGDCHKALKNYFLKLAKEKKP